MLEVRYDPIVDWKEVAKLSPHEQMRAWVENWKRIGPELEREKRRQLRALTEEAATERALRVMKARVNLGTRDAARRATSGLIEQQRIFSKFPRPPR